VLEQRLNRLRSIGLGAWLGAGSVIVTAAAIAAMAFVCVQILDALVRQEGITRAQLAGASAREALQRAGEDALASARVLSERPTLQRLLADQRDASLQTFLRRFCTSSRLDTCAVLGPEGVVAAVGDPVPWAQVTRAINEQGERFMLAPAGGEPPIFGAAVEIPGHSRMRAVTAVRADRRLLADIGEQVGARVSMVNYATYVPASEDPLTLLHSEALSDGRSAARRLTKPDAYVASVLVSASTGELVGLMDVSLDAAEFDRIVADVTRQLVWIAIIVAALAGLAGMLYGRWIARPITQLRDAAVRIGQGDFAVSIPPVAPKQLGELAATMDEMQRNLVELTTALRHREAEAQAVLGGIVEGVYAVDSERRIRYVNPQAARLLGRSEDELLGRFCGDVLNPHAVDGERPCTRNCPILIARKRGRAQAAERLCLPDGRTRSTVIVSAAPVDGQQVQVIRDETDLEAARRARDSVLAHISHEFRTPVAAQLASLELLRDGLGKLTEAEQRTLFESFSRGALRLMRLIDNLLESVRIESGQLTIRRQRVALDDVVSEAAELVAPLLAQRGQKLEVRLPEDMPEIIGDSQRLTQVFVNLLSNAVKFAPESGEIRIGGELRDGHARLWVEDEGPGVEEHDSTTLFDRFRRGSDAEPDAPGLGLGLWIVKSIIERHGGHVGVERVEDRCTRFWVSLPLAPVGEPA